MHRALASRTHAIVRSTVTVALVLLMLASVAPALGGDFEPAPSPETVGDWPASIALGDLDGDGDEDLAVGNLLLRDATDVRR